MDYLLYSWIPVHGVENAPEINEAWWDSTNPQSIHFVGYRALILRTDIWKVDNIIRVVSCTEQGEG